MSDCGHENLILFTNPENSVYQQPTDTQLLEALQFNEPPKKKQKKRRQRNTISATNSQIAPGSILPPSSTFPAPLVLPGDELWEDPEYPPQSVQDWIDEEERNEVTSKRDTIYVIPPPATSASADFVEAWTVPQLKAKKGAKPQAARGNPVFVPCPRTEDVVQYLRAFYHGVPVKLLEEPRLEFASWDGQDESVKTHNTSSKTAIGLSTGSELVHIRDRACFDSCFPRQLNLNDLLDVAISILPKDAYALLMLVNHDLYESDEDDFCCGRAYGGSRVAVVSSARYRPELDSRQKQVPLQHAWPGSHCMQYILEIDTTNKPRPLSNTKHLSTSLENVPSSAIPAAVIASNSLPLPSSPSELGMLWLGRVCKTASHELGHCFGIDHCTYYACVMQGTASLAEDSRQPPYLCPIDLAKVLRATGADGTERYESLLRVCQGWQNDRMFAAFAAWIRIRLSTEKLSLP